MAGCVEQNGYRGPEDKKGLGQKDDEEEEEEEGSQGMREEEEEAIQDDGASEGGLRTVDMLSHEQVCVCVCVCV